MLNVLENLHRFIFGYNVERLMNQLFIIIVNSNRICIRDWSCFDKDDKVLWADTNADETKVVKPIQPVKAKDESATNAVFKPVPVESQCIQPVRAKEESATNAVFKPVLVQDQGSQMYQMYPAKEKSSTNAVFKPVLVEAPSSQMYQMYQAKEKSATNAVFKPVLAKNQHVLSRWVS